MGDVLGRKSGAGTVGLRMGVKSFQSTLNIAAARAGFVLQDMFAKGGPMETELKALRKAGATIAEQRLRIADLALQGARRLLWDEYQPRKVKAWPPGTYGCRLRNER